MDIDRGDSASPAVRGFRLQILYTLARLIEPQTTLQATLWPEGIEGLAICDGQGVLREAIQTKGHTKPLTLSELVSESGKGPLQRAVAIARAHPECRIRLLSFGPYGQELLDAWRGPSGAGERVQAKLDRTGFKAADIAPLFTRLTLESTDEASESNNLSLDLVRLHVVIASIGLLSLPWNGGIRRLIHPNRAVPAASPQR